MVMLSGDVNESRFPGSSNCIQYCAYHSFFQYKGVYIAYGVVPSHSTCRKTCGVYNFNVSPNGDVIGDHIVDLYAHELSEAVVDPAFSSWLTADGEEMADMCLYRYGNVSFHKNGAASNIKVGGKKFLVQTLPLSNGKGGCLNSVDKK